MTIQEQLLKGFDYKPLRDWCSETRNYLRISNLTSDPALPRSNSKCVAGIALEGKHPHDWYSADWLQTAVFDLFPLASIQRLRPYIKNIVVEETSWFDWNSTADVPIKTDNPCNALSPTALIPASCYLSKNAAGHWCFTIYIYPLPGNFAPLHIQQLLLKQALVHEVGHGLVKLTWCLATSPLRLGDRLVGGEEVISQFIRLIRGIGSISEYSASCRGENTSHDSAVSKTKLLSLWAEEELVESITAAVLGWTKTEKLSTNANFRPFKDRPKVYDWVVKYLNATW